MLVKARLRLVEQRWRRTDLVHVYGGRHTDGMRRHCAREQPRTPRPASHPPPLRCRTSGRAVLALRTLALGGQSGQNAGTKGTRDDKELTYAYTPVRSRGPTP